ncbi:neutral/alkaline nonlysosomal ceramidase [Penicillium cataractarum]|uniref:Neutral ceramidase n=1 Tax=Penicillium cataractarum TaxID=2100454 RepID=A0A9W9RGH8_9EURO|nr:neutral/alkaline nonlysosomal ceramidase [Penicillium cataractarum]KAJ5359706.1 neutral/alkaline nonlysosomal ceramidase [Penicillium cataractarum]
MSTEGLLSVLILLFSLWGVGSFSHPTDSTGSAYSHEKRASKHGSTFLVGVGKADITGAVVQIPFAGYGQLNQTGTGLRQRIYARSFVFADPANATNSFIYVVLDAQSGDTAVRHGILQGLQTLGGKYRNYGEHNVAIATLGSDKQTYTAIVEVALLSIQRAYDSLAPSTISVGTIDIPDGNINRSPYSYLANPATERAEYTSDTDTTMTLLTFDRLSDGDNKGVAAYLFERGVTNDTRFADNFVAGFSQSSVGDLSPNVLGPFCEDTGLPCDFKTSTCNGRTELCQGRGPYFGEADDGAKSAFEMGRRQYNAAFQLYGQMASGSGVLLAGESSVASYHTYQNMSGYEFISPFNGSLQSTCYAALGTSFAGGTSDGPGAFDFTQNNTSPNPFWQVVRTGLHQPGPAQIHCQYPKQILFDVGAMNEPYAWAPDIVDVQALRLGQLLVIVSPSEITTMSGRRWKSAIADAAGSVLSISDPIIVLASPADSYAHYVTTEEEYTVQRYEGASTLYGPNQLAAYVNLSLTYLPYLGIPNAVAQLPKLPEGPKPPVTTNYSLSFIPAVVFDRPILGHSFGDVLSSSPNYFYSVGDYVSATFVGANPRNDLRLEKTYAAVEMNNDGIWEVVRTDADWNLTFEWNQTNVLLGTSQVSLTWQIEDSYYLSGWDKALQSGIYRLHYYGESKDLFGTISSFEGVGPEFSLRI